MTTMDIFNDDAFSLQSLTALVNKAAFVPGQIGATDIFDEEGVTTTIISVEERDGQLSLVEPTPRGGPGETTEKERRNLIPFKIPHYERNDAVMADEVQNVRAFGSEMDAESFADRVARRQTKHLRDLDATLEHQRVGAIKGVVSTKSGAVLENLYTRFGIAVPAPVSLELDIAATKVSEVVKKDVIWSIEDELDDYYGGFHAFCGRDFFSALWHHQYVRETMLVGQDDARELRREMPERFDYAGVLWERYRAGRKASADVTAAGGAFIADNEAQVVVTGVPELFITRFAPADYEETVNTIGLPRYMKQYAMPNGKGRNIDVQSNPISLCTRPGTLKKLTLT